MMQSFVMVIFGATGDLAKSKLLPALFSLYQQKQLPETFSIIGFARRPLSDDDFRSLFASLQGKEGWENFATHLFYQQGNFEEEAGYSALMQRLDKEEQTLQNPLLRLFYLATPPINYNEILDGLEKTGLTSKQKGNSRDRTRLIIEKPFGKDLETARALDKRLGEVFEEQQIFRVDHYLGKETVQNMIAFRFANGIFEPVWNNKYIDHVQITWGETKGVETRGKFFDGVGLLRDVAQNHLMQLVAAVAMEQPKGFSKEAVREARAQAIEAVRCIQPEEVSSSVVRGQYEGYKKEKDVAPDSTTETFVAMKLFVDTPRFENVPFYLRASKKAPKDVVEISIVFIQTCHILFKEYGCPEIGNVLTIRIQPDEGIGLRVIAKKPGNTLALGTVDMKFSYQEEFGSKGADAYEKLLLDVFAGDQMLFNRSDELESSWDLITQVLKGWDASTSSAQEKQQSGITQYPSGAWGPNEANNLIEKDGRKWL